MPISSQDPSVCVGGLQGAAHPPSARRIPRIHEADPNGAGAGAATTSTARAPATGMPDWLLACINLDADGAGRGGVFSLGVGGRRGFSDDEMLLAHLLLTDQIQRSAAQG